MAWNSRTDEQIRNIVENKNYIFIDWYFSKPHHKQRKIVIEDSLGYKYDVLLENFIKGTQRLSKVDSGNPNSTYNIDLFLRYSNKNFRLSKSSEYKNSKTKLEFICNICENVFFMNWSSVNAGQGCYYCSGRVPTDSTRLSVLYPDISKEWHPKNTLEPYEVSYGSDKIVWWLCDFGHEYKASISNRCLNNSGCPICWNLSRDSKVARELKKYCRDKYNAISEYRAFKNPNTNRYLFFDIFIDNDKLSSPVFIEIHGGQHYSEIPFYHRDKTSFLESKKRDSIKKYFAQNNGVYVEIDLRRIKNTVDAIRELEDVLDVISV